MSETLVRGGTTSDVTSSSGSAASATGRFELRARGLIGRQSELARLRELLDEVRAGGSVALLLHGEPGVGKSALLTCLSDAAAGFQVVRAVGAEGEVDLPYAGLHQLCRSLIPAMGVLPQPQRDAVGIAFGLSSGEAPDRYLVGLAVLNLMSESAVRQPLLCVVDDAQWLDAETTRALAFVGRRLGADSVALIIASRATVPDLEGLPDLHLHGLTPHHARALLDTVLLGRLDDVVRERILAETHGNPLALIELPHASTPAESPARFLEHSEDSVSGRIEDSFMRRLEPLPDHARQLLVLAALEPLGDSHLLLRAAAELGLGIEAADAATEAGLLEIRERTTFRHPLVRSAVYRAATPQQRRSAHRALAEATDPYVDPDRRAWHRACATVGPDEDVAEELVRTAARAKARGGLAAAGAFLERAALATTEPRMRTERALAAAEVMLEAGAFDNVERLLRTLAAATLDELQAARADRLGAQVTLAVDGPGAEASLKLLAAAGRLRQFDSPLADAAYLEAFGNAFYLADPKVLDVFAEAIDRSAGSGSGAAVELLARGWAQMLKRGFPVGTDLLRAGMMKLRDKPQLEEDDLRLFYFTEGVTKSLWDFDSWQTVARRSVQLARESGALSMLPSVLMTWADVNTAGGDFVAARRALAEAEAVREAIGTVATWQTASLDAWQLKEVEAFERIDAQELRELSSPPFFDYARAVVYNAAGRYEAALEAAQRSCDRHPLGTYSWALVELVEAATRCGEDERALAGLGTLIERTRLAGTEWALGLEARCAALVIADQTIADDRYREAIKRLGAARTRPDLARAHLLYGEWLRRQGRRIDAREQLRTAHDMFSEIGVPGFADRARRELAATGELARRRKDETRADLTAQEAQIARLALEGLTNPQIGAQLFLSPRTVEWHLRRVYPKLGISSRRELHAVQQLI